MNRRQTEGRETWRRLIEWDRGQSPSERLSAHILRIEGYKSIDPSHPLGGPDGLKDIVCIRDNKRWIGASYFPRGQKSYSDIEGKFLHDLGGVIENRAEGIVFVTNQELSLSERGLLNNKANQIMLDLYRLERISSILDSPICYGIRLEYLDIEMTKEEQVAFLNAWGETNEQLRQILTYINQSEKLQLELKDIISKSQPENSQEVVPITQYDIYTIPRALRNVHKCSFCGYGYIIKDDSSISTSFSFVPKSVICPKCGYAEGFTSLF
jgi:rubredoxin